MQRPAGFDCRTLLIRTTLGHRIKLGMHRDTLMLRESKVFTLLFLATRITLYSPQAVAQALNPTGFPQWDSTNQVLFFGPGSPSPIVRAYVDAHQRGADIDILKDFPGLQAAYIDSLTAGPDGTTLIAATLNFGNHNIREVILTHDSSGQLMKTWDPAPQYVEAIAYSKDHDAIFVLGGRELPKGPYAPNYPLLIEYSRDGRVLKAMAPASLLRDREYSFQSGSQIGQPLLRVTKDHIYFYASTNHEVVMCDRDGVVLAYRSFSDAIEKISTEDGYRLEEVHQMDFAENGDLVLELLLWNDDNNNYVMEVVRLNIKTGEAVSVHKALNSGRLSFVGMKDDQYLYLEHLEGGQNLYTQSATAQEPQPLVTQPIM
jgi:hypothetical protein